MWCEFIATDAPGVYRCRRCGFATAPTAFPPVRIRRACQQRDPRRLPSATETPTRGFGDTVSWWIDKLSFGRLKERSGCGCRRRREWLNRLLPYRREPFPGEGESTFSASQSTYRVLLRFPHGLGDAVQLTTVLLHLRRFRPEWRVDVEAKLGAASLFAGLAHRVFVAGRDPFRAADYDLVHTLAWYEPDVCYRDTPSTKAERSLREAFHIVPRLELCRYQIQPSTAKRRMAADYLAEVTSPASIDANGRYPAVVIHYQGNSARRRKNLDEQAVRKLIDQIVRLGFTAAVLDFETPPRAAILTTPSPDWPAGRVVCPTIDHPLWRGDGTGDGAMIAALIAQAKLFVGIDSGPGHIAAATDTPSVIVWTGHHPIHYCTPSANAVHLVPDGHRELLRGRAEEGERFFETHYQYRTYRDLHTALPRIAEEMLTATDATAAGSETALVVDGDYWVRAEHRAADMVIVRDVDWQDAYRIAELRLRPRTVLDIGAHIGCFATRAKRRWPAAEVTCVEANPANLEALRSNVAAFARVLPWAATYAPGPVKLASSVYPGTENTGGSHVLDDASAERLPRERPIATVPAMNLEQILAACGWEFVDLVKLDCEGCEFSLLEYAQLDRFGAIVGEYHDRTRFDDLVGRRFASWELRRLTDNEPGLFWLINPAHTIPREA